MVGKSERRPEAGVEASFKELTQRQIEDGIRIAGKAQEQGMPSDPSARRDLQRRRAKTICMSGGSF
jgi:hypothetical protein